MNYTSANLAFVLDAKLYLLFERYIGSLPADQRALAMDEQRLWLQQRIQAVDKAYAPYEGGTFASYAANEAFIDFTKQRIAVLERRLGSATTMP